MSRPSTWVGESQYLWSSLINNYFFVFYELVGVIRKLELQYEPIELQGNTLNIGSQQNLEVILLIDDVLHDVTHLPHIFGLEYYFKLSSLTRLYTKYKWWLEYIYGWVKLDCNS